MEKNSETQDKCSFTTQILRKGDLDSDKPDALVSLSLLRFPASFWMFKPISSMGPANWIWIPLKEKTKKKKKQTNKHTKLYNSSFTISLENWYFQKNK